MAGHHGNHGVVVIVQHPPVVGKDSVCRLHQHQVQLGALVRAKRMKLVIPAQVSGQSGPNVARRVDLEARNVQELAKMECAKT